MGRKRKSKHFILGKDLRDDGQVRITRGEDWLVEGGTRDSHEETSDIVHEFSKRLRREGQVDRETSREILKDVLYERKRRN